MGYGGRIIESGSLTPGVSVESFGLPEHTAARLEIPALPLRGYLTEYHALDSDPAVYPGAERALLPGWPLIRFTLTDQPVRLKLGPRIYDPVPTAALYGTTTRAMRITTTGGVTIGVGVSPLGWSRLFRESADRIRDQVVPLDRMLPPAQVSALYHRLRNSDQGADIKPILDSFFLALLGPPSRDEPLINAFIELLREENDHDLASASERVGISPVQLRRLTIRYFGFPPKILMIRARFMRSLIRMLLAGPQPDYSLMASSYFDLSHFLRDADRFLGTSPRRFMAQDNRFLIATLRARQAVIAAMRDEAARRAPAPLSVQEMPPVLTATPIPAPRPVIRPRVSVS